MLGVISATVYMIFESEEIQKDHDALFVLGNGSGQGSVLERGSVPILKARLR